MRQHVTSFTPKALALSTLALMAPGAAIAACDIDYVVQPGDTYYSIAEQHFGQRSQWQMVFEANRRANGQPALLPGNSLYIPCLEGMAAAPAPVAA